MQLVQLAKNTRPNCRQFRSLKVPIRKQNPSHDAFFRAKGQSENCAAFNIHCRDIAGSNGGLEGGEVTKGWLGEGQGEE